MTELQRQLGAQLSLTVMPMAGQGPGWEPGTPGGGDFKVRKQSLAPQTAPLPQLSPQVGPLSPWGGNAEFSSAEYNRYLSGAVPTAWTGHQAYNQLSYHIAGLIQEERGYTPREAARLSRHTPSRWTDTVW